MPLIGGFSKMRDVSLCYGRILGLSLYGRNIDGSGKGQTELTGADFLKYTPWQEQKSSSGRWIEPLAN